MRLGVLFSGGKDSCYAAYLKRKDIVCLISIDSKNKESFMFHTPSISQVKKQAESMGMPLVFGKTEGKKEEELKDLESAISQAKKEYAIEGIVTGAVKSEYQRKRIDNICNNLGLKCINPLWHKDEISLLKEIVENGFEVIITGVFAFPFDEKMLGRVIDEEFIEEMEEMKKRYEINPAGEGGEIETFVLNCPMFKRKLRIKEKKIEGENNSFRMDIVVI